MKRARGASEEEHPEESSAETTVDYGQRDVFVVVEVDSDVKLESLKPSDFDLQVSLSNEDEE